MCKKYVAVPIEELQKLEQARIDIINMCNCIDDQIKFSEVTGVMWKLANKRWKRVEVDDNK